MKIIKASIDFKTWSLKWVCPNCTSEVEIEVADIFYDWNSDTPPWRITCCLCDHQFRIDEEHVPKLIQADCRKNRYIRRETSDW